jgi:energy-coupling factor transport system permease protein
MKLHPLAWVAWLCSALVALSVTRNPLYLLIILLCVVIVDNLSYKVQRPYRLPVGLFVFLLFTSTLFNALTVHYGNSVLFSLPHWIPVFGGSVTLEAALYGLLNGCTLIGFLLTFQVIMQVLSSQALVGLLPPAFYPIAVVVTIALGFVPTTLQQIGKIRDAQAIRGHRLRGWRDWLPLWMPLLIGGLERAFQLAEAMVARGFASNDRPQQIIGDQIALVSGMLLLLIGWFVRLVWGFGSAGIAAMLIGGMLIGLTLWRIGKRTPRSHYRTQRWLLCDSVVVAGSLLLCGLLFAPIDLLNRQSLYYYPYPEISAPSFQTWLGLSLLSLLMPILVTLVANDRYAKETES